MIVSPFVTATPEYRAVRGTAGETVLTVGRVRLRKFPKAVDAAADDDEDSGVRAAADVGQGDLAIGIAASGRTPFVAAALATAASSSRCEHRPKVTGSFG